MKNLVPIKVKIGLRANGHADHPNWNMLNITNPDSHMHNGWHYDKSCGHKESSVDSPFGMQWGMLLVTAAFAKEAMRVFPSLVTEMTPAEAEAFWNTKVRAHMPENSSDLNTLQALQVELDLKKSLAQDTTALEAKIAKALDPDDETEPGIKKDKLKYFADAKVKMDVNMVDSNFQGENEE